MPIEIPAIVELDLRKLREIIAGRLLEEDAFPVRHDVERLLETGASAFGHKALRGEAGLEMGGVARVDSFLKEDTGETWVMEINTIPGSFSSCLSQPRDSLTAIY